MSPGPGQDSYRRYFYFLLFFYFILYFKKKEPIGQEVMSIYKLKYFSVH
jgi:hypothetical protein